MVETDTSAPPEAKVDGYGIRATSEGLFEIDSGRLMAFIPRAEVVALSLQHGPVAQRPLVQAILGGVLIVFGLSPLPWLWHWATHGGTAFEGMLWIVGFAVIGAWMVFQALRRGLHITVDTTSGTRKLAFSGRVDEQAAKVLVSQIRKQFGYAGVDCVG